MRALNALNKSEGKDATGDVKGDDKGDGGDNPPRHNATIDADCILALALQMAWAQATQYSSKSVSSCHALLGSTEIGGDAVATSIQAYGTGGGGSVRAKAVGRGYGPRAYKGGLLALGEITIRGSTMESVKFVETLNSESDVTRGPKEQGKLLFAAARAFATRAQSSFQTGGCELYLRHLCDALEDARGGAEHLRRSGGRRRGNDDDDEEEDDDDDGDNDGDDPPELAVLSSFLESPAVRSLCVRGEARDETGDGMVQERSGEDTILGTRVASAAVASKAVEYFCEPGARYSRFHLEIDGHMTEHIKIPAPEIVLSSAYSLRRGATTRTGSQTSKKTDINLTVTSLCSQIKPKRFAGAEGEAEGEAAGALAIAARKTAKG